MVARDTRYLPFPKEGIEAFKRRTLDTTRHLTCSGAHSRKPLSWVSYLFSRSLFLFLSRTLSTPSLSTLHRRPCDHPPTLRPPILALLSLSRSVSLSLSRTPRSACDSKPQDTCCIACLLTHSSVCATVELFYVQVGVRRRDSSAPERRARVMSQYRVAQRDTTNRLRQGWWISSCYIARVAELTDPKCMQFAFDDSRLYRAS